MTPKNWIIRDLLSVTIDYLKKKNIESPRLCAEILLSHQLNLSRLKLYLEYDQPVGKNDLNQYRAMIKRAADGEPIQYITGVQEFWSMDFMVSPAVLIPRPETEILVEQAIKIYKENNYAEHPDVSILDMGTGSGAIAVAVASELKDAQIVAVDISKEALETAKLNIARHGVENRISLLMGNLFEPFGNNHLCFDIILTNPPYVTKKEFESLPGKIKNFEPRIALESGEDGLSHIRTIIEKAPYFLKPGGWLMLEMDPGQVNAVILKMSSNGYYSNSLVIKDHSHRDRVIISQKK